MELVYDGSWVTKPIANFPLDKRHTYLSTNDLKVRVFLMDRFMN